MTVQTTTAARSAEDSDIDRSPEASLRLYGSMLRIRMVEEEIAARYPVEEQKMRCPVHLSVGQEAIAVGASACLRPDDQVVSNHRCHAHYLAKGGDLLLSLPVVGSSIPIGVGAALAFKQQGRDAVCVIYLGDAALEEGVYHESANFAALQGLSAIFMCENNLYSVYTHLRDRQPPRPLLDMGRAHGMPGSHIDGNDVDAVVLAVTEAVDRARGGRGPSFILADTYRWREHCGPFYDNDLGYRSEAEFAAWRERDGLARMRGLLSEAGILDSDREAGMVQTIEDEIAEAFAFAEAVAFPDADSAGDGVYA
jgi:pyruvate dehydrogenase E1 component alpha subunit